MYPDGPPDCQGSCCPYFEERHRNLVKSGLANRKKCLNCGAEHCRLKCSGCMTETTSVGYCNKECQRENWPEHKTICKTFQHMVKIFKSSEGKFKTAKSKYSHSKDDDVVLGSPVRFLKYMENEDNVDEMYKDFVALGTHAFCISVMMHGINAQVTYCLSPCPDDPIAYPLVYAENRLYDIFFPFNQILLPERGCSKKIEPIPYPQEFMKYIVVRFYLQEMHEITRTCPWAVPIAVNVDDIDRGPLAKWQCRRMIQFQCMTSPKDLVLSLYNDRVIQSITGQSKEEFSQHLGILIDKQVKEFSQEWYDDDIEDPKSKKPVKDVGGEVLMKLWKDLNLKPVTLQYCPYTDVSHNTIAVEMSLRQQVDNGFISN